MVSDRDDRKGPTRSFFCARSWRVSAFAGGDATRIWTEIHMKNLIQQFVAAANAFDVEAALALFAPDAVIDDVDVGEKFENTAGVRKYLESFFVGYHTASKLESVDVFNDRQAKAQLDFTGDFGHETGALDITTNADGLIVTVHASLDE